MPSVCSASTLSAAIARSESTSGKRRARAFTADHRMARHRLPAVSDRPRRALTVALPVVAVLVAAWFAIGGRQARDQHHATAIITRLSALTPAEAARAADALDGAGWLNP